MLAKINQRADLLFLLGGGMDVETITEQVNFLCVDRLEPEEVNHIIDKLNEIYL